MWSTPRLHSPMSSSPLPIARPWTPPDMDETSSAPNSTTWSAALTTPPPSTSLPPAPFAPQTPMKPSRPTYPYTPDSARAPSRLPALSPMPWQRKRTPSTSASSTTSPVQSALFSCLNGLEQLIHTQEPNDAQMEYIVAQLESISSYLSAPEAQSRVSDDHLFDAEGGFFGGGVGMGDSGIADMGASVMVGRVGRKEKGEEEREDAQVVQRYREEVDAYVRGVRKHIEALKSRMGEVAELNSIHLEIIRELRRELGERDGQRREEEEDVEEEKREKGGWLRPGGWAVFGALGDALDEFGEMFFY
ncbi:hypothetical protein EJ04DRAFT_55816 [Polyplosphaeria fusca]|uniref:Uncharacterized protein n=1 Tax=Polyplosphaeria fusca TaxID=682080 RepID=A0A9P4QPB4_9PLEO|nr:hypothetical protein EJ04DRAFT_55816 [Polyplosphaeria fusca]